MTSRRPSEQDKSLKDWWKNCFTPIVGEVLFVPQKQFEMEVAHIIKRSGIKPPRVVLDLACGVGRHSAVFAARGFKVTGLDYSKPFVREARLAAQKAGQDIRFVQGDMKSHGSYFGRNEFDLVVSLFNSFGYFGTKGDGVRMLKGVYRVLRPGGSFVLNTLNGAAVAKRLKQPISFGYEPITNVFVIDAPSYDAHKKQTISNWTIVDTRRGKASIFRRSFRQNVYSHAELKRLMVDVGFTVEDTWGMLAGGRFNEIESWHQTIMARKR